MFDLVVSSINLIKIFRLIVEFKIWCCFNFDIRELEKKGKSFVNPLLLGVPSLYPVGFLMFSGYIGKYIGR